MKRTPTIIKAEDHDHAVQRVAFNLDDLTDQARKYLDKVRAEASQILATARQKTFDEVRRDAAAFRAKAEAEGRRVGEAAVDQKIEKRLGEALATLLPALRQAVADIQHARHAWLTHWEQSAVHVAAAIARRLLRRELAAHPEIAVDLLREALELAAGNTQLRIHLNPADLENLRPQVEHLLQELSPLAAAEFVADPDISPAGCRVETRFGVIDQQLEIQLQRIEEELT